MKKLLLGLLALSMLLTGCTSGESGEKDVTIDLKALEAEVANAVDADFASVYEQFSPMYDAVWAEQFLYMTTDLYEELLVVGPNPMMSNRGFEVVMVKAAEGKEEDVAAALQKRVDYGKGPNTEFYGSMEAFNKIVNAGSYYFLVAGNEALVTPIQTAIDAASK